MAGAKVGRGNAGTCWQLCVTLLVATALLPPTQASAEPLVPPGIRILVVKTEAEARDALAAYNAGVPFDRLVRERSIGPERERGGYLGRVDAASVSPPVRAGVAKTPRGRVSPIFGTDNGFAVVYVLTVGEEEELEARLRREPEAQTLLERGTALGKAGDLEGAESLFRQAIALNPDLADAHFNLAIVQRRRGNRDAAVA